MSIYMATGTRPGSMIGSNAGWSELRELVEYRDLPELRHLAEYGWNDDAPGIVRELETISALANARPDEAHIAGEMRRLLTGVSAGEPVVITSGFMRDDDGAGDSADATESAPLAHIAASIARQVYDDPRSVAELVESMGGYP